MSAHATKQSPAKNRHHPSALMLKDLNVGRRIIVVHVKDGIQFEGIVKSKPYVVEQKYFENAPVSRELVIDVQAIRESDQLTGPELFISDLGVSGDDGYCSVWSREVFTIDARERALI